MTRRHAAAALLLFALLSPHAVAVRAQQPTPAQQAQPQPTPTPDAVERIKDEGLNRSQLMQTLEYLTDGIGPRLTGSPALRRANAWTRDRLTSWGLSNAHLEPWGPFGRGWTLKRFSAEAVEPVAFPLLAYPRAWSPGLEAPLTAELVVVDAKNEEELQKYKGQLRGKFVLIGTERQLRPRFEPTATRLTDKELLGLADAPDPSLLPPRPRRAPPTPEQLAEQRFNDRKTQFYYEEGVALLVASSPAGDGGMLQFVQSASVPQPSDTPFEQRKQPWQKDAPRLIPQIALSNDHYNRLARMLRQGEKVKLSVNLQVEFDDSDPMSYNTVAEIPGTDLKDEVVMLGAHLDSWHTATGATDNGAGVSIMMEAVRILKALNLQPRRTVRIALWSGEEQGLLGSRAYVNEHFGPVPTPTPAAGTAAQPAPPTSNTAPRYKPEHARLNVYFNVDSGTGAIRGVHMQGNEGLRPFFRRWLMPFAQLKVGDTTYTATTVTAANTGGSDFLSFDAVGLNGIDFLQDEMEYGPRTWHSNQDNYDRAVPEDLKEAAVIVAAFVYQAATMDGMLPRKQQKESRQ
ncbi:MAG: M20/M25/M40 family metallo-hydrolase [Acidobacteria bacterium]|nr:M20/M25/M40 family metallo-hydrolase [Acidobacteriota bacterium]MBV9924599.1 M20/M25/M40 family metallo-hydrolase [Acidobacteriota bacterium]